MNNVLEIQFIGWTATPRLPFVLSGNAICLPTPTYSLLLGIIGCCIGRIVNALEVQIGFHYVYDETGNDMETRHRLEFDGKRVKKHAKGTDAYVREFHVAPHLTIWINRVDWQEHFLNPAGTPSLGRSQDILKIESVRQVTVERVEEGVISGCMLPFSSGLQIGGQLVQLAEAFQENEEVGGGRKATRTRVFMSIPHDNTTKIKFPNLYQTKESTPINFYLHNFQ